MGHQLFVDFKPEGAWVGVVSATKPNVVLEKVVHVSSMDELKELSKKENPKGRYTHVYFGCAPKSQFVKYGVLENPTKAREEDFFDRYLHENFQINLKKNAVSILSPGTGLPIDLDKLVPKELIFCGASDKELQSIQKDLLSRNLFPERLELGSVATLGGIQGYLSAQQIANPMLMLEWGNASTEMMVPSARKVELIRTVGFGTQQLLAAVCSDLGLKDAATAQKLIESGGFDLNEMGASFLKGFLKELQASMGFFEVQTGQTIKEMVITRLPDSFRWVEGVLSKFLGIEPIKIDYQGWANSEEVRHNEQTVNLRELGREHLSLFSLMVEHTKSDEDKKTNG